MKWSETVKGGFRRCLIAEMAKYMAGGGKKEKSKPKTSCPRQSRKRAPANHDGLMLEPGPHGSRVAGSIESGTLRDPPSPQRFARDFEEISSSFL